MVYCKEVHSVCTGVRAPETLAGEEFCKHVETCSACTELFERLRSYRIAAAVSRHLWDQKVGSRVVSEAVIRLA